MRRRWLLSLGLCAATVLTVRGWSAKPAEAAALTHVAELAVGDLGDGMSAAQSRYLHSQPNHWRQYMLKR
jgi:hypothetical protein